MQYFFKSLTCSTITILSLSTTFLIAPNRAEAGPEPFIGDIIAVGYTYCPRGWASAEGQLLPIASHTAVFSLLGTTYGGDGRTTFGLPDLRGRLAMGQGRGAGLSQRNEGQKIGAETHILTTSQLPSHSHAVNANNLDGDKPGPGNKILSAAPPGGTGSETIYSNQGPNVQMSPEMIEYAGSSQPFNIQDPYKVMRYCIALQGIYPSRD